MSSTENPRGIWGVLPKGPTLVILACAVVLAIDYGLSETKHKDNLKADGDVETAAPSHEMGVGDYQPIQPIEGPPPVESVPALSRSVKTEARSTIELYGEVRDVTISQNESDLRLTLVVSAGTTKAKAKELGDSFIRIVKSENGSEPVPGREIGKGIYNYEVFVFSMDESLLAYASKRASSQRPVWR